MRISAANGYALCVVIIKNYEEMRDESEGYLSLEHSTASAKCNATYNQEAIGVVRESDGYG